MAIISKQIGWGNEENLTYEILKQLNKLRGIVASQCPPIVPTTTTTTTTAAISLLDCVYYSQGIDSNFQYDVITNTPTAISLPGDAFSTFAVAHTQNKYWKGDQYTLIKEWDATSTPGVLTYNRDITVSGIPGNFISCMTALNNTTLIVSYFYSLTLGDIYIASLDITTNSVGPAQITELFATNATQGVDSICVTTTNKILTISRRDVTLGSNTPFLTQYSFPGGVLEVDIDLSSISTETNTQWELFENGGVIYIANQFPFPQSALYSVDLTAPYTIHTVYTLMGIFGGIFNSSPNCNTVNLIP